MIKKVLYIALSLGITQGLLAQRSQRIAYIDMEYILTHIPEYQNAQLQLNQKVFRWQDEISKMQVEMDKMKSDLNSEKALLTKDMIAEREEDIDIKQGEIREMQNKYFGSEGELFKIRQQLVKPIQDQVYNAIQEVAVNRQFDFVLDKSSDLIMLYSNNKYDISDQVVNSLVRSEKERILEEKKAQKLKTDAPVRELTDEQIEQREELEAQRAIQEEKQQEVQDKIQAQKDERAKKREEQLKAIEEARKKKLEEREEARKKLEEKRAADQKAREEKAAEQQNK